MDISCVQIKEGIWGFSGTLDARISCKGEMLFPDPGRKLHPQLLCSNQAHRQCTHMQHTDSGYFHARTHTHTHHSTQALSISVPDHREFVLSWLGRQDESMRGQLTGHAYSSAKEKGEKKGVRDSKRNELSPGATCLALCITLQILQRAFSVYGMKEEEVEKMVTERGRKINYCIRLIFYFLFFGLNSANKVLVVKHITSI